MDNKFPPSFGFQAFNVLTEGQDNFADRNYWLSENGKAGKDQFLLMDLGCVKSVGLLRLINTHNGIQQNRGTKKFRYSSAGRFRYDCIQLYCAELRLFEEPFF